ncbi:putative FBD-associated F-box protein At5g53635 [Eucalyptus grandis]|uniref:putative FBD-associated F-box protein At5g53635 n=1 Tax=Eucalyptus grandis TaxID=71139 RepID=UPI00192ECCD4|nr:putative FBD-associated F-box protein At5g53635 [Eucalyptus grandis]
MALCRSPGHSPVPHRFEGPTAMLGFIGFALARNSPAIRATPEETKETEAKRRRATEKGTTRLKTSSRPASSQALAAHLTTANDLVFNAEIVARLRSTLDFSSLVDSVLIQCISPTVKRFHVIGFKYEKAHRLKFDLWLRFAEGRRVEDLSLLLVPTTKPPTPYILPRFLYCWSWLVRLEVWACCFSLGRTIRWPCLKILVIAISRLSDDILEGIFRGCPVLESLELWGCWGTKNIMIDSTSVKELVLIGLCDSNIQTIWAPHLLSLRISGDWQPHAMLRLSDVSSLVEAKLDFSIRVLTDLPCDEMMCSHMLKETLQKLRGVTTITIGAWCFKKLSLLEMEGVPVPLSICQSLTLHADITQWNLLGIAYMLRISQCLEKLVICMTGLPLSMYSLDEESKESFNYDEEDFCVHERGNFNAWRNISRELRSPLIILGWNVCLP